MRLHDRCRQRGLPAVFVCLIAFLAIVYVPCSASDNTQAPQAVLSPSDAADQYTPNDLGAATAISGDGNTLVLGSPYYAVQVGAAYVFTRQGETWSLVAKLSVPESPDNSETDLGAWCGNVFGCRLGFSVAINYDGSVIVLGAPGADTPIYSPYAGGGAAFVFVRPSSGSWADFTKYTAKLTNSDGNYLDQVGGSVAVSDDGNTVIVGAPYFGYYNGPALGKVYLYSKPSSGWASAPNPMHESTGLAAALGEEEFGSSVAISGDGTTVVGGAPAWNGGAINMGRVYVFVMPSGGWPANTLLTPNGQLLPSDGSSGSRFGSSVAITRDASSIVVGAPKTNGYGTYGASSSNPPGEAYVFFMPPQGWVVPRTEDAQLFPTNGGACDGFGGSVAINGDGTKVAVGSDGEHSTYAVGSGCSLGPGAAYSFHKLTAWSAIRFLAPGGAANDQFGSGVSLDAAGDLVAIGAPGVQGSTPQGVAIPMGKGYVFLQAPSAAVSPTSLQFNSQPVGTSSAVQSVTLTNNGTEPLTITSVGLDPGFQFQGGTPNCLPQSPLAPGSSCDEYILFAPTGAGGVNGNLSFQDNSGNVSGTQQTVSLSGTGVLASTTTTITAVTPSPALVGQPVIVYFSVGWGTNIFNPYGNVAVSADTGQSCMGMAVVDNCTLTFDKYGTRSLTAVYAGDSHFSGSTSSPASLNVADFSISAVPAGITVPVGSSGTSQITIGSLGGFNYPVALSASGIPAGASASVSPNPVTPPGGGSAVSTLTVNLGPSITPTTFSAAASGTYGTLTRSAAVGVTVVATAASVTNVVNQILTSGCINNSGVANAFNVKLAAAQSAITAGKPQLAVNILYALLYQLQAQSGNHLATSCTISGVTFNSAAALMTDVQTMIAGLNLAPNPILGYVVNGAGVGVGGATISILKGGTAIASATTDATGFYYFANAAMFSAGSAYTAKPMVLPSLYKSTSPAYQNFSWQGAILALNVFTAN